jgi:hypothetical protein
MRYARVLVTTIAAALMLAAGCSSIPEASHTDGSLSGLSARSALYASDWPAHGTFSWAGPEFWPDRVDGWHTVEGKLLCQGTRERPMRHITLANPMLGDAGESFSAQIDLGPLTNSKGTYAGFLLGLSSALPYPSATTATLNRVIFAGVTGAGDAVIAANPSDDRLGSFHKTQTNSPGLPKHARLILRGIAFRDRYTLVLSCRDASTNKEFARAALWDIPPTLLRGHIAIVAGPSKDAKEGPFWFENMRLNGPKILSSDTPDAGPILGAWHAFNHKTLRVHVQTIPISPTQRDTITLSTRVDDAWRPAGSAPVNADGSAMIEISDWPYHQPTDYLLNLPLTYSDTLTNATYTGTIRPDPTSASLVTIAIVDSPPPPPSVKAETSELNSTADAAAPHALLFSHGIHHATTPEERLAWALTYAQTGRTRTCLGAFPGPTTCGGIAITQSQTHDDERSPDEQWQLWSGAEAHINIAPDSFTTVAQANRVTNETSGVFRSPHICPTLNATNGYPFVRFDRHRQIIEYHRVTLKSNQSKIRGDLPGWPVLVPVRHPDYERPHGYLAPVQVAGIQDPLIQVIDQDAKTSVYLERVRSHIALPRVYKDGTYTLRIGAPELGLIREIKDLTPAALANTETARISF